MGELISNDDLVSDVSFAEYSCFFGTVKRFLQSCVKDCELRRRKSRVRAPPSDGAVALKDLCSLRLHGVKGAKLPCGVWGGTPPKFELHHFYEKPTRKWVIVR